VLGNGDQYSEAYTYVDALGNDVHGCMASINSMKMAWDFKDQLQQADLGGGGVVYYVYSASGRRVRKVVERNTGLIEQRIYLDGFEIFRRQQGAQRLERETLHVADGKKRIALVETRTLDTAGSDSAPPQLIRYQFGNHVGSATVELDQLAQIISYEEYTPYGSTSYQAVRSQTETPKRYRYIGKERDQESGFCYHGARYYAPWLGRWLSCDPAGFVDGLNLYAYARLNPIRFYDDTGSDSAEAKKPSTWERFKLYMGVAVSAAGFFIQLQLPPRFTEIGPARKAFLHYTFGIPYQEPTDPADKKEWDRGRDTAAMVILAEMATSGAGPPPPGPQLAPAGAGAGPRAPAAAPRAIPGAAPLLAAKKDEDTKKPAPKAEEPPPAGGNKDPNSTSGRARAIYEQIINAIEAAWAGKWNIPKGAKDQDPANYEMNRPNTPALGFKTAGNVAVGRVTIAGKVKVYVGIKVPKGRMGAGKTEGDYFPTKDVSEWIKKNALRPGEELAGVTATEAHGEDAVKNAIIRDAKAANIDPATVEGSIGAATPVCTNCQSTWKNELPKVIPHNPE